MGILMSSSQSKWRIHIMNRLDTMIISFDQFLILDRESSMEGHSCHSFPFLCQIDTRKIDWPKV
jgi:hypothetical protein